MAVHWPICRASLSRWEIKNGWCESCAKRLFESIASGPKADPDGLSVSSWRTSEVFYRNAFLRRLLIAVSLFWTVGSFFGVGAFIIYQIPQPQDRLPIAGIVAILALIILSFLFWLLTGIGAFWGGKLVITENSVYLPRFGLAPWALLPLHHLRFGDVERLG